MKTIPIQSLRLLVGVLGMFFAYSLGRMATRLRRQGLPMAKAVTWILRTAVVIFALLYGRGFDAIAVAMLCLIAASLAAGVYVETRPRKVDEIHLFRES